LQAQPQHTMSDSSGRRNDSRELHAASMRLRERVHGEIRRSLELREAAAAAIARALILKTVFVCRRGAAPQANPPLEHALFRENFEPQDRSELLTVALECAKRVAATPLVAIQLRDSEGVLRIEAHAGLSAAFVRFFDGMDSPEYLQGNGQVWVADVASDALLAGTGSGAVLRDAGIRSIACTPIVHDSNVAIGLLSAYYRESISEHAANLDGQQRVAARIAEWLQPEPVER